MSGYIRPGGTVRFPANHFDIYHRNNGIRLYVFGQVLQILQPKLLAGKSNKDQRPFIVVYFVQNLARLMTAATPET